MEAKPLLSDTQESGGPEEPKAPSFMEVYSPMRGPPSTLPHCTVPLLPNGTSSELMANADSGLHAIINLNPTLSSHADYPRQPTSLFQAQQLTNEASSIPSPARYRGNRELDLNEWNDTASARLRFAVRPPGDLCDCLALCRRPLGLRRPPEPSQMVQAYQNGRRKPFGVIWLVRDACGICCLIFTWLLILYAEFVVSSVILMQSPSKIFCWLGGCLYHVFAFLAVMSHFKAFSTDPGSIPLGSATKEVALRLQQASNGAPIKVIRCPKCLCIKPSRAHHCSICRRCVRKMDHHCPWINNCVGEGNQKYFFLFTMYICLMSLSAIYMSAHFIVQCIGSDWEDCRANFSQAGLAGWLTFDFPPAACTIFSFGLICEGLLFGIFTLIMSISQICNIYNDETGIESLKKERPTWERHSRLHSLMSVFGSPFSWRWFSPFSPPPPVTPIIPPEVLNFSGYVSNMAEVDVGSMDAATESLLLKAGGNIPECDPDRLERVISTSTIAQSPQGDGNLPMTRHPHYGMPGYVV